MKRFKNILCIVDPEKDCTAALEHAVSLAENNQASLTIADVTERVTPGIKLPDGGPGSTDLQTALIETHTRHLENLVRIYSSRAKPHTKVLKGTPFLAIIHEVLRNEHDLVIKIPEDPEWLDKFFGSDDMHLLRKCPCPVWLIKPQANKAYRRILAAVDIEHEEAYSPEESLALRALNHQLLEMAFSLALSDFSELHIAHVWEAIGESTMRGAFIHAPEEKVIAYVEEVKRQHETGLHTLIQEVTSKLGTDAANYLKPRIHLVKGRARKEIPVLVERLDADLVVMGTVARTGIPGFFIGNTAESILNQIKCSVLAIKPPGFETPVTLQD